jgi:hypothetical protein
LLGVTYGTLRFRIAKLLPGLDHDLIDGWISDRYTQILDEIPWRRRELRTIVQTVAPYETGSIALTEGSTAVTGTGTTFTSTHTGARLYVATRNEVYSFTYVSGTTGTLDRAFEGTTGSYSYKLYRSVIALPAAVRLLQAVTDLQNGPLGQITRREANEEVGVTFGMPVEYRLTYDDASSPPNAQIEVFPAPSEVTSLEIEYVADESTFATGTTSNTLLPWVRPACLIEGVQASGEAHKENWTAADYHEGRFAKLLQQMIRTASYGKCEPVRMRAEWERTTGDLRTILRRLQMP